MNSGLELKNNSLDRLLQSQGCGAITQSLSFLFIGGFTYEEEQR